MRRTLIASLLATVIVSPAAAASAVITPDGSPAPTYSRWVERSFAPAPPGQIVVSHDTSVCNAVACADAETVYVDRDYSEPGRWTNSGLSVFFHELGHVFDMRVMTDESRDRFAAIFGRRFSPEAWGSRHDFSLGEWFAEGYRLCAMYRTFRNPVLTYVDGESYAYEPTAKQQRRVCRLLRRLWGTDQVATGAP